MSEFDRRLKRLEERVSDKTGSIARFGQWLISLSQEARDAMEYADSIQKEFRESQRKSLPTDDLLFIRGMALRAQAPKMDPEEILQLYRAVLIG